MIVVSINISFHLQSAAVAKPAEEYTKEAYPPIWRGHVSMALQDLSKFPANAYAVSGDVTHLQQVRCRRVID